MTTPERQMRLGAFFNPTGPWTALPVAAAVSILFGHLIIGKIVDIEV